MHFTKLRHRDVLRDSNCKLKHQINDLKVSMPTLKEIPISYSSRAETAGNQTQSLTKAIVGIGIAKCHLLSTRDQHWVPDMVPFPGLSASYLMPGSLKRITSIMEAAMFWSQNTLDMDLPSLHTVFL